jgi:hypothetical protein
MRKVMKGTKNIEHLLAVIDGWLEPATWDEIPLPPGAIQLLRELRTGFAEMSPDETSIDIESLTNIISCSLVEL